MARWGEGHWIEGERWEGWSRCGRRVAVGVDVICHSGVISVEGVGKDGEVGKGDRIVAVEAVLGEDNADVGGPVEGFGEEGVDECERTDFGEALNEGFVWGAQVKVCDGGGRE